ncbi:MAG: hypothetical protein AAFY41_06100, partial [Bacteroidota bacterium]
KITQTFMIIAIIYGSGFAIIEETAEKTERTESEQEAVQWDALKATQLTKINQKNDTAFFKNDRINQACLAKKSWKSADYNIHFIYHTSYLDLSYLA